MHKIRVINLQDRWPIDFDAVRNAAQQTLNRHCRDAVKINVVVMDNPEIRKHNARFLEHDYETDVLAFRYGRSLGGTDGEVLVSVEQAHLEARNRRIPPEEELLRYVVHGVLHFLGFRDKNPKDQKEMFRAQESILKELGTKRNRHLKE
jgi:probable rRNA maturation factor